MLRHPARQHRTERLQEEFPLGIQWGRGGDKQDRVIHLPSFPHRLDPRRERWLPQETLKGLTTPEGAAPVPGGG